MPLRTVTDYRESVMRRFIVVLVFGLIAVVGFSSTSAQAQPESCPQHCVDGTPPALLKPQLAQGTQAFCYEQFAVLHSEVVRTPLWSAEHLTRDEVESAGQLKRRNSFHHEARLPPEDRAELGLVQKCRSRAWGGGGGAIWGHSLVCWMPDALQVQ